MTGAELDAMVSEVCAVLRSQPMVALGLTTLDAETFWQVMRRVHGRLIRNGRTADSNGARSNAND